MKAHLVIVVAALAVACAAWAQDAAGEDRESEAAPVDTVAVEETQAPESGLRVIRAYICKGIEQSEPTEAGRSFIPESDGILRLCCFSEIGGAARPDTIAHVWYWGEREMATVKLPVRSARWRTWSTKKMIDEWLGEWHVDIVDSDGAVLQRLDFSLE